MNKFLEYLAFKGFMKIPIAEKQIGVVFKITAKGIYYVVLIDDKTPYLASPDQVTQIVRRVRSIIVQKYERYAANCEGIALVISEEPERSRAMLPTEVPCWLVNTLTKQLMVFDDQPWEFYDIRQMTEGFLNRNPLTVMAQQIVSVFTPVNTVIIVLNILVFVVLEMIGSTEDLNFMYHSGAMYVRNFWESGEYYRLFTSMFLHFGFLHLFFNMFVLLYLGGMTERILGKVKYLIVYLVSGLGASVISVIWYTLMGETNVVFAGASGAICGVAGALTWVMLRDRIQGNTRISLYRIAIFVAILLAQGAQDDTVSNCAHVGGFICGFVLSLILYHGRKPKHRPNGEEA